MTNNSFIHAKRGLADDTKYINDFVNYQIKLVSMSDDSNALNDVYSDWIIDKSPLDYIESKISEDSPLIHSISDISCFLIRCCHKGVDSIDQSLDSNGVFNFIKPVLKMLFIYYCTPFGNVNHVHTSKLYDYNSVNNVDNANTRVPPYFDKYYQIITDKRVVESIDKWYETFESFVHSIMTEEHFNPAQAVNVALIVAFLRARD